MRPVFGRSSAFAVLVIAGALVVGWVALGMAASRSGRGESATSRAYPAGFEQLPPTPPSSGKALAIQDIYRRAGSGVVDIRVATRTRSLLGAERGTSEGAGVVYDTKGDILTDAHVVANAKSATVTLADHRTVQATVVGRDPSTDVAVVRVSVPAWQLHPLALANSARAEVGDPVVAIGSPFGLPETVTSGIVSALGRSIPAPNRHTIAGAIQTDAPINPGNSGGPLLDGDGHVLGLADQIDTGNTSGGEGQSSGVGFVTPSNLVANVANRIIAGIPASHPYLGVSLSRSR